VPSECLKRLIQDLANNLENSVSAPIVADSQSDLRLMFVPHNDLIIACVAASSADIGTVFTFLHRLVGIFCAYFESFMEESVRDNFVIIYELLDEVVDNGYPQLTEPAVLGEFIKIRAHRLEAPSLPSAATNTISWRKNGIFYKKNEVFLDVIERCSLLVDGNGKETHSQLTGTLTVRSQLSGLPVCQLSLNERATRKAFDSSPSGHGFLEDMTFHPCVDLATFRMKHLLCFTPPDGKFDLMTYRTLHPAKPLININATMSSTNSSRIEYAVSLSTLFKEQNIASNIQVEIPVSPDTTSPEIQCSCGTVVYDPEKDALLWTLRNIKGKREFKLQAKLCVPSTGIVTQSPGMTPVRVTFEIPYNTASGLQVKYLKVVEKDGYSALPWVRYITRSNGYEFRFRK